MKLCNISFSIPLSLYELCECAIITFVFANLAAINGCKNTAEFILKCNTSYFSFIKISLRVFIYFIGFFL